MVGVAFKRLGTTALVQTALMFSKDGGVDFGLRKCRVLCVIRGKLVTGNTYFYIEFTTEIDEKVYEYLCILVTNKIRANKMKEAFRRVQMKVEIDP